MNILKSVAAIFAGLVTVFVLSLLTDYILESTGIMKMPFGSNPLWLMISVTIYRNVYVVAGGYVTAILAPNKPMKHALILGGIGFILGTMGAIAMWHEPPHWYPIALVIFGLPSAWLGGKLKSNG
jgi:hypothetical protein